MATLAAHHGGSAYDQDKLTVHNIIIRNIADGSDAYTYVKPLDVRLYVGVGVGSIGNILYDNVMNR